MANNILNGKRILIIDDEPDILGTLKDLLDMCDIVVSSDFDAAKDLLENQYFDFAILDIMGVNGYELLRVAKKREVIAVMLTAHALTPENIIKSYKEGAASYIPKDKMFDIKTYLNDILEAKKHGKSFWWRWYDRFATSYCEKRFGPEWQKHDKEFWKKIRYDP